MWLRIIMVTMLIFGCRSMCEAQTCNEYIAASAPDSVFIDNGDSTVTDTRTGLMWKQCVEGQSGADCAEGSGTTHTWQEALLAAESANTGKGFAGYTDWRLPNGKELASLVEMRCYGPAINTTLFPNQPSFGVWAGSAYGGDASSAWGINFNDGNDYFHDRTSYYYVRLVRGGE